MRAKLAQFMAGRNGGDELARFVSLLTCILLLLSVFIRVLSPVLWALCIAGLVYSYFRMFSRNIAKRREENARFLSMRTEFSAYFRGVKERRGQRKDYKFFRCPSCRTVLRVPKGKGKVKIICRKCGTSFVKKT